MEEDMENEVAKIVIKSHAFLLDQMYIIDFEHQLSLKILNNSDFCIRNVQFSREKTTAVGKVVNDNRSDSDAIK